MTYSRQSPDYTREVREIAARFPADWEAARKRPDGSRDDAFILTAGNDAVRVSEVRTGRPVASFDGHRGALLSASLGPGAGTVVTVGVDGLALVHDCPACAPPAVLVKRARAVLRAGG